MSKIRKRLKHKKFMELSRNKRGDIVTMVKGRISKNSPYYGGKFTSHLVLDTVDDAQWFDFLFTGRDRTIFWNAYIETAKSEFNTKISDMAHDRVLDQLSPDEFSSYVKFEFEPCEWSNTGKATLYKMKPKPEVRYEKFGGLTVMEQMKKVENDILNNEPPDIYERFELNYSYKFGIGLTMIVDVDKIDKSVIESAIDKFLEMGCVDWVSQNPVDKSKLLDSPNIGYTSSNAVRTI